MSLLFKFSKRFLFIFIINLLLQLTKSIQLLYPVSFGVVRTTSINVNLNTYMKNMGYPDLDQKGNNIGYNIVSLDGYKTSSTSTQINNDLSPFSTWINIYSRVMGNAKNKYGKNSNDIQQYIKREFNNRAARILFNAFSFQRPISQKDSNPEQQAQRISQFVTSYYFDGVSIDFQDFNSVKDKKANDWLTRLLKNLRKNLGKDKIIVLQIHPTFIKELQIFKSPLINSYVNLFVVKYYNLLKENYSTFQSLFTKSPTYEGTSLWELQQNKLIKMDICKTVIAKPAIISGTWTRDAFLSSNTLGGFFDKARTSLSWFGGYANLDLNSDLTGNYQLAVLSSLRTYCNRYQTCFCS